MIGQRGDRVGGRGGEAETRGKQEGRDADRREKCLVGAKDRQKRKEIHEGRAPRKERETGCRDKGNYRQGKTERDRERQKSRPRDREGRGESKAEREKETRLGEPGPALEKRLSSAFRPWSPGPPPLLQATDPPGGGKEQNLVPDPAA